MGSNLMYMRRRLGIESQPHLITKSGEIVTFSTPISRPLKSLILSLSPIQSGSGDPSPDNVRPITGHTSASVVGTGKNLLNLDGIDTVSIDATNTRRGYLFTKPGTYYIKALKTGTSAYLYAKVKDVDGTYGTTQYIVANTTVTNKTITITSGQTLIVYDSQNAHDADTAKGLFSDWGIIVSPQDMTTYEAYSGTTHTVSWE